jgi:uncharacterized protein YpmB
MDDRQLYDQRRVKEKIYLLTGGLLLTGVGAILWISNNKNCNRIAPWIISVGVGVFLAVVILVIVQYFHKISGKYDNVNEDWVSFFERKKIDIEKRAVLFTGVFILFTNGSISIAYKNNFQVKHMAHLGAITGITLIFIVLLKCIYCSYCRQTSTINTPQDQALPEDKDVTIIQRSERLLSMK